MTISTQLLEKQIKELEDRMFALECSDDFLFTNRNGNLPYYRSMQEEVRKLRKQMNYHIDTSKKST